MFIIKRSVWLRGAQHDGQSTFLYRFEDDKMCCVGIYLASCGVDIE